VLENTLKKSGLPPHSLEIEVTEGAMMQSPESMLEALKRVKALGISLALDDFGTGHSSLAYLQRFPFDKLKIDRSFIRNVTINDDDAAMAVAICAMAKSLHLKLIAEGVENQEQVKFLKQCGCNDVQGYHFSRPLPVKECDALLNDGERGQGDRNGL
jgi:EAL domain-containing protein (putative c-di-GMP-specific phosphodiesterase class I)